MNKKVTLKKLFFFFLTIFILVGCSTNQQERKFNVKLGKDLIIKESDENEHQNFSYIRSIDVDKDGSIYLLDQKKVLKFDKSGKFLWALDKHGQGPGEFQRIVDLSLSEDGRVFVADQTARKIMIFSAIGKFMDEFKIPGGSPINIATDSQNFVYVAFLEGTTEFLLHKYSPEGKLINSFLEGDKKEKNSLLRSAKNSFSFCVGRNDHIIVSFDYEYKILKYNTDGELIAQWSRELPYKPQKIKVVSPQPNWMKIEGDLITQDITTDSYGNIYVLWGNRESENGCMIDMFSPGGELLGNFSSSVKPISQHGTQGHFIDNSDNLYVIEPVDEPKVYRFKMMRE
ncbi:MAG: NHL repeat-containing protein [Candidatus Aminicenantes bacterium]|nr:NHL repeat-containing protein [Candidatus Aminicenantes bacterium]